ncbi:MAG: holin [Ruminococcaceae bacterium]|nr:holin [Oscillospiraceae bacterium]
MKERLKSPVLLLSVAALIAFITKNWIGFEIPKFDEFTELVLAVLVAFGVVNNPTDKTHF